MQVWKFAKANDGDHDHVEAVYKSVKETGKSRFGWSWNNNKNLVRDDNYNLPENEKQRPLLDIKKGDWIVHTDTPSDGKCIAGKVISEYNFDNGIKIEADYSSFDFCNFFELDKDSIIEFDRDNENIDPKVNGSLKRRGRLHKILEADAFIKSIEKIKKQQEEDK